MGEARQRTDGTLAAAEARVTPGITWSRLSDLRHAYNAVREAGPGTVAYILVRRPPGPVVALALRNEAGRPVWVEPSGGYEAARFASAASASMLVVTGTGVLWTRVPGQD
ncbi:hypothetical protein ACIA5C_45040 [Actinoplanes sp. NPDC051343]|uniref:hypothetical protein n=1 Tax=Actinoplanes sp. NPDC051343 TaxID=3363906 RepID=UPI0037BBBF4D